MVVVEIAFVALGWVRLARVAQLLAELPTPCVQGGAVEQGSSLGMSLSTQPSTALARDLPNFRNIFVDGSADQLQRALTSLMLTTSRSKSSLWLFDSIPE